MKVLDRTAYDAVRFDGTFDTLKEVIRTFPNAQLKIVPLKDPFDSDEDFGLQVRTDTTSSYPNYVDVFADNYVIGLGDGKYEVCDRSSFHARYLEAKSAEDYASDRW